MDVLAAIFWILVALAAVAAVSIGIVVLLVRALYRRIRRSRAVTGGVLRNRARFSWGPKRRVLTLRMQLHDSLDSGRAAIDLAVRGNGRRGELPRLFRRIETEGLVLDAQLRLMESETDSASLAEDVAAASLRVEQVADMVRRVRASVAAGLGDPTDDTLGTLNGDLDREVAALHAGLVELRNLHARDPQFVASRQTSSDHLQAKGASS